MTNQILLLFILFIFDAFKSFFSEKVKGHRSHSTDDKTMAMGRPS